MDTIFHKTNSIFSLVSVARNEPHRYGKNGELLVNYQDTEEHLRRASYVSDKPKKASLTPSALEGGKGAHVENQADRTSSDSS
jgi:hypothetical protein